MITSLHIHHLALIEDLQLEFHEGMHTLTGETGAGKSIVVDAVNLGLGGRADRELIRTGTDKAWVELVFDAPGQEEVHALLRDNGIEYDGRTVTLYREITRSGRNLCRLCGTVQPLSALKQAAELLMDVHGQHEHQFLMDPQRHMQFLDASGDDAFQALLRKTAASCEAFLVNHRAYARLVRENEQKGLRMSYLENALEELRKADLRPGEEEELEQLRDRCRHTAQIADALGTAQEALSPEGEESLASRLRGARDALNSLAPLGAAYAELAKRCANACIEVQELAYDLSGQLLDGEAWDGARLEQVESRLDLIRRLERKYGPTLGDVLAEQEKMQMELERFTSMDQEVAAMGKEHRRLLGIYRGDARALTAARRALAEAFEARLTAQLADLGMEKLAFRVQFHEPEPGEKPRMPRPVGDDRLEFMISPNPGEPLKPLSRIASGGELSRIMLAIKTLEAEYSGVGTMVFDEIDTGISGRMAQAVAEKMALISRRRQVISVTHLPQLAAMADHQYLVEKREAEGRTNTLVRELTPMERTDEVARMISGAQGVEPQSQAFAMELLRQAGEKKRRMSEQLEGRQHGAGGA